MRNGIFALPWWGLVLYVLVLTHITIIGVTVFLHRHQAHRALELAPAVAHFFRFWLWLTTGMITKEWAAVHRKHHAKCETADDPHSPQVYGICRVLFGGVFLYVKESRNAATLERYGGGTPDDAIERRLYRRFPKVGIILMLGVDLVLFGFPTGIFVWVPQMLWIPFWAAGVVNGIGHYWGYRNCETPDRSTNFFPWGIVIGGEELHNNHHAFPTSAKLSMRPWEFDIGWVYIRLLALCRLSKVKRAMPKLAQGVAREPDAATLDALVTFRFAFLSRFMRIARANRANAIFDELQNELESLWARSAASKDELTSGLRDWCTKAESCGVDDLEKFSVGLRSSIVSS